MSAVEILALAKRLKAMSHLGLTYATDEYDIERYKELEDISLELIQAVTGTAKIGLKDFFSTDKGYITPKVDVRAVVFNDQDQILLVKEKADGKWSLPGGWADIGQSPSEVAKKEVEEETGYKVSVLRPLAILDQKCHPHPPQLEYVYKIFISCKIIDGSYVPAFDILEVGFFGKDHIPPLSENRVLLSQIELMFEYHENPAKQTTID